MPKQTWYSVISTYKGYCDETVVVCPTIEQANACLNALNDGLGFDEDDEMFALWAHTLDPDPMQTVKEYIAHRIQFRPTH